MIDLVKGVEPETGFGPILKLSEADAVMRESLEPELLEGFARSLPEAIVLTKAHQARPPGFWGVMMHFRNRNFRRGLVLINSLLEAFGRNLPPKAPTAGRV